MKWATLIAWLLVASCAATPKAPPPRATGTPSQQYRAFLAALPGAMRMRHQVQGVFGEREEVIDGFLVLRRAGGFWLRAMGPMGVKLFDVRAEPGHELAVQVHVDALRDKPVAAFLARDIQRMYLDVCPVDASAEATTNGVQVTCALDASAQQVSPGALPDQRLELELGHDGLLARKTFWQGRAQSAEVRYLHYEERDGVLTAQRIDTQVYLPAPYRFYVGLVSASFGPDAARALEAAP